MIQIVLLTREIFSNPIFFYEQQTGDRHHYRNLVINKIITCSSHIPNHCFSLASLIDLSLSHLTPEDYVLICGLLDTHAVTDGRFKLTPYLFTLGSALEVFESFGGTENIPFQSVGYNAIIQCHNKLDWIPLTIDKRSFITAIVHEVADDYHRILDTIQDKGYDV